MESKSIVLSFVLAFLLVGAGFSLVAIESSNGEEEQDETPNPEQENSTVTANNPPVVLVDDSFSIDWTGMNATIGGFVSDEVPENTFLSVRILNGNLDELYFYNLTPSTNGAWSLDTSLNVPGEWIVEMIATDDVQQSSEPVLNNLKILSPVEEQVAVTFRWDEPGENDTNGTISGLVIHQFPESCSIEYHPLGQSPALLVQGTVNVSTGAYTIIFDTESHNTEGDIIAECGLFNQTDLSVRVVLPMPPEPVGDADGDAVLDDSDECPSTPQGEPVYSTGCSDSETDDDEDGVMNDTDLCPNSPTSETVDSQGCAESQKDTDDDGVNNVLDQCANTPLGESVDAAGCSASQKDDDADGVTNDLDECPNTPAGEVVDAVGCTTSIPTPTSMKILALHGGGDSASGLASQQGMQDLVDALPEFEFVFASTPESGNVWYQDPPGGKGEPTTDPDWADLSIAYLDQMVIDNGPFYALLGYSQGSAMIPVYLANTQNTFDRVMLYNGYLPTTHHGLMDTIDAAAPFSTPAMIFSGENDASFKDLAPALAQKFTGSLDLHSQTAGHHLPYDNDQHFNQILSFIRAGIEPYDPVDSWYCQDGTGPWVKDFNGDGNGYTANSNGVSSAGGGGSGPWFQCEVSVTIQNNEMIVESNGIPNHDFLSTMGCCAPEKDFTTTFPLNPVNDTTGGHDTTNCPASAGRWECVPDRGTVAMSVNGAPIFGPEEGPGGDAVALHFDYFNEDRQPIVLGWCTGHSAGQGGYHYHYDANCVYWEPEPGETMEDYDSSKIKSDEHSPIIGWAFDGYPIYGMYGYNEDQTSLKAITSSYGIERTQDGGDQGYNGIDDWNYVDGSGDLDECNGRFGPTPEYPDGIYHYVSTPLSGSPTMVTDTNGQTVGMIGFPYFLLCYHGVADVAAQNVGGGQGGGPGGGGGGGGGGPPGGQAIIFYEHMPELIENVDSMDVNGNELLWNSSFVLIGIIALIILRRHLK
ncbi:MAG: hypothetical protein CMA65_05870 [Euryarchaeota archaeon]|nr:hypothetical protein [Euryarchaeota archaeon]